MATRSWYAWLALRRRVSMSAIGSVIVMVGQNPSRCGSPKGLQRRLVLREACERSHLLLPGSLGNAGELTEVGHFPDTDAAQAKLAVDRLGSAAPLAPGVGAHRELRLRGRLDN